VRFLLPPALISTAPKQQPGRPKRTVSTRSPIHQNNERLPTFLRGPRTSLHALPSMRLLRPLTATLPGSHGGPGQLQSPRGCSGESGGGGARVRCGAWAVDARKGRCEEGSADVDHEAPDRARLVHPPPPPPSPFPGRELRFFTTFITARFLLVFSSPHHPHSSAELGR